MFAVHKSDLEVWAACTQQLSLRQSCLESSSCMLYVASQLASYLATYLILFWLVPSCSQLQRYLNSQSKSTHSIRSCYLTFTWKQAGSNLTQLANNTYLVGLLLVDGQLKLPGYRYPTQLLQLALAICYLVQQLVQLWLSY